MNKAEIFEKVKGILVDKYSLEDSEVTFQTSTKDLEMDSLDYVEFIMDIENYFNFKMPDTQVEKFNTISDIVDFIETAQDTKPA